MSLSTDYVVNTSSLLMAPLFRRKCSGLMLTSSTQRREKRLATPSKPHQASPMRGLRGEFRHVINPRLTPTSQLVHQLLRVRRVSISIFAPELVPKLVAIYQIAHLQVKEVPKLVSNFLRELALSGKSWRCYCFYEPDGLWPFSGEARQYLDTSNSRVCLGTQMNHTPPSSPSALAVSLGTYLTCFRTLRDSAKADCSG